MKWLIFFSVVMALIAFYVAWLRPHMQKTSWGQSFLDKIEPMERALWWKSETILWARAKIVVGLLSTALIQAGQIDIEPALPLVPEQYRSFVRFIWGVLPLCITMMGFVDERLRKETTKPLEVVAMRTDAPVELKAAAAEAQVQMKAIVAEVKATEEAA